MSDEDPSENSPASDSTPKKETVRITLPPKPEDTPMIKRETVRINAPGVAPKKETTTITGATPLQGTATAPVPPPPSATRPLVPPPAPRPPSAPGLPSAAARPGVPPVAPRPAAPAAAPKAAASYAEARPVTIKAAPKKETARIQVAPTQKLPPQATVKLSQPTQSLSPAPSPAIRTAAAPAATVDAPGGSDTLLTALSWAAVVVALGAAVLSYLAYSV